VNEPGLEVPKCVAVGGDTDADDAPANNCATALDRFGADDEVAVDGGEVEDVVEEDGAEEDCAIPAEFVEEDDAFARRSIIEKLFVSSWRAGSEAGGEAAGPPSRVWSRLFPLELELDDAGGADVAGGPTGIPSNCFKALDMLVVRTQLPFAGSFDVAPRNQTTQKR